MIHETRSSKHCAVTTKFVSTVCSIQTDIISVIKIMDQPPPGVTVLFTSPVQDVTVYHNYKTQPARILGALQIFLALVILILQIVVTILSIGEYGGMMGYIGFIFAVISGSFGVYSSKTKSRCSVITTMILSIIAAVFFFGLVIEGGLLAIFILMNYCAGYDTSCGIPWDDRHAISNLCISTATLGLVAAVVAITQAAFCCQGCCSQPSQKAVIATVPGGPQVQYPGAFTASGPPEYTEGF